MTTVLKFEKNDGSRPHNWNYSANELFSRCRTLETQNLEICRIRNNLLIINKKNESISKSLLKIKTDYENYRSHLCKALDNLKVSTEKQKILLKKKSNEYFEKRKAFEAYCKASPIQLELEELIDKNKILEEKWKNKAGLCELTKKHYYELMSLLIKIFKKKVCEFCDAVLRLEGVINQVVKI